MACKITFVINHSAFFVSHRLAIAKAAIDEGFSVTLITGQEASSIMDTDSKKILDESGIKHKKTSFKSSSLNLFLEFIGFIQTISTLIIVRPQILHAASIKGIIYGGLAAKILRINSLVISISGLGFAFTGKKTLLKKILSFIFMIIFRIVCSHKNKKVIVQNEDDKNFILTNGFAILDEIELIKGSGVDLSLFKYNELDSNNKKIIFPARLLIDKGVVEFLKSSEILFNKFPDWKFILVGADDYKNPSAISKELLNSYLLQKNIINLGFVKNMHEIFNDSAIVCLPSYREGMPKSLLEAASVGRPIVTTNTIGCKESIIDNYTGLLVPVGNSRLLSKALMKLMESASLRKEFGLNGRKFAEDNFDVRIVQNKTIEIYKELIL